MLCAFPKQALQASVWAKGREERGSTTQHGWGNSRLWGRYQSLFWQWLTQQNLLSVQCLLQAHPLELTEKEHNKQSKEIPNPGAGKQILKPFWSQSYKKFMRYLYQAPRLVSVKFLVSGCKDQYQKLFLKVHRKQTACNETLAKQEKGNLGTNFLHWKSRPEHADKPPHFQDVQNPRADPIPCLTAQGMVGLRVWPCGISPSRLQMEELSLQLDSKVCVNIQCPLQRGHIILLFDKCGMLLSKWNLFSNPGLLGWGHINHSPAVVRAGYADPERANSWAAADLCPESWYSPE